MVGGGGSGGGRGEDEGKLLVVIRKKGKIMVFSVLVKENSDDDPFSDLIMLKTEWLD